MKLWGGRFSKGTAEKLERFNASITIDQRMYKEDIKGSIAHSAMLAKQGIISFNEANDIKNGLLEIKELIETGNFEFKISDEDIHMAIESKLIEMIGEAGKKLHTGRSRNDQVALDSRLYIKSRLEDIKDLLKELLSVILNLSKKNMDVMLPGYTHMQRAQPILFAHHLMAYFQMFKRDLERLNDCLERVDINPLGAGALAGTTYPIDRNYTTELLGMKATGENSLDLVSDRDYMLETSFVMSMIAMHLSRFSEEIIIWNTSEFSFIKLDDAYTTGSSIMPQKKNPDIPELVRGKSGRVYGNLIAGLTMMKGLPLAYNKDTQEDKESVFDSLDTIEVCIDIFKDMLDTMKVNKEVMENSFKGGFINATDVADYLAKHGIPFREAHKVVGEMVAYAEDLNIELQEIEKEKLQEFSPLFGEDFLHEIEIKTCVENRNSYGGTSPKMVEKQISNGESYLVNLD